MRPPTGLKACTRERCDHALCTALVVTHIFAWNSGVSRANSDTTFWHKPTIPPILRLSNGARQGYLEGKVTLPVDGWWLVKVEYYQPMFDRGAGDLAVFPHEARGAVEPLVCCLCMCTRVSLGESFDIFICMKACEKYSYKGTHVHVVHIHKCSDMHKQKYA